MRNIRIANRLFAGAALCFGGAFYLRLHEDAWWASVLFFLAQSAFIGCAADWFAVTALFQRPLGFPFHTALIPRHRMRIIQAIRRSVEEKLVRPELWTAVLASFSASALAERIWQSSAGRRIEEILLHRAGEEAEAFLAAHEKDAAAYVRQEAEAFPRKLAGLAAEDLLGYLLRAGVRLFSEDMVRTGILNGLKQFVAAQKTNPLIEAAVAAGEAMGVIDYGDMRDAICQAGAEKLTAWQKPGDPFHQHLLHVLQAGMEACLQRKEAEDACHFLIQTGCDRLPLEEKLHDTLAQVLLRARDEEPGLLRQAVAGGIEALFADAAARAEIDEAVRDLLTSAALYEHAFLGDAVESVLAGYDEKRLNHFIYEKTGEELGWIRINGALVAAAAGAALLGCLVFALK